MNTDIATRVRQGADAATRPEILLELARDPSVTVRASLAMNPALPPRVSAMLAADEDERVRMILSRKIANLAPGLPAEARERMQQQAIANLTSLVAQAARRIRASVSEAVRDLPDGPREIVLRLAYDPEVMIAEPVIRFSPLLTSEDLITLIASAPAPGTIVAVAQRPGIDAIVADAVVETADTQAIGALLANHTAQIREATLDALAAQSEEQTAWQEPLVRRPTLPIRAQRVLADIVAGNLLQALATRPDLEPRIGRQLQQALEISRARPETDMRQPAALAHAQALRDAGRLDDRAILGAMQENAIVLATAMFAVRTDVPIALVEQAFGRRNARAVVALAWRGGLSMQTAVVVQAALARLPPDVIVRAGPKGGYPLPEEEMRRQLRQLGVAEAGPRPWTPRRLNH